MRLIGRIVDATTDRVIIEYDGSPRMLEELKAFNDNELVFAISKYHKKRSISANGYFWLLVDMIARKLGTDKNTVYLWLLRDAGVSVVLQVVTEAIPALNKTFRLVEEIRQLNIHGQAYSEVICYYGSSTYDSKEMAHLIDVTMQEAARLGCDVWTDEEVRRLFNDADE